MISDILKNTLPEYEITLPISNKKYKFRPMTVKEEKILLLAQDEKSPEAMARAIVKILQNCMEIKNPEKLAIADVEFAFLALRSKSTGENVTFGLKTPDMDKKINVTVNLETFELEKREQKNYEVKINDNMVLILKDPDFSYIGSLNKNEEDKLKSLFKACFVELQTKENVYKKTEVKDSDLEDFYDYMTIDQIKQFSSFVQKIPRLKKSIEYQNSKGENKTFVLTGLDSFFVSASVI